MKRITIEDKNLNTFTYYRSDEDADQWLTEQEMLRTWGDISEYSVCIEELSVEQIEAINFLWATDWYVIREFDDGTPCPEDVKEARAEARELL